MSRLMKKRCQPSCPKCGAADWSVTKDSVRDQSTTDYVEEKAQEEGKDVLEYLNYVFTQEVVFVFCYSCGYTLSATKVDEEH